MQVTQTTFGNLHHKTRARVTTVGDETARVFLARSGRRLVGSATVTHQQGRHPTDRTLAVSIQADSYKARIALQTEVRERLSYLHRRFTFN